MYEFDKKTLYEKLKDFPTGDIKGDNLLIEVDAENSFRAGLNAIKNFTDRDFYVITLSSNRPCTTLLDVYTKYKINMNNVSILDTICKSQGLSIKDTKSVIHTDNIKNLTDIAIHINKLRPETSKQTILFIDSLTTMLIYNDETIFTRFIHNILTKMRSKGINVVIVILKTERYQKIKDEISQIMDQTIKL